jgi:porin
MGKSAGGRLSLVVLTWACAGHVNAQALAPHPTEFGPSASSDPPPSGRLVPFDRLPLPAEGHRKLIDMLFDGSDFPFGVILCGADGNEPHDPGPPSATSAPAACTAPAPPAPPPFDGPCCTRPKLTGDWCGLREQLRDEGYTFDISATTYYQGITSGGLSHQFEFGGRNDYILNVDGQKAGLWQRLSLNVHGETVYGRSVNLLTGAIVPANIGRSLPTIDGTLTALTAFKVTQAVSDNLLVYAGKINTVDNVQQPFIPGRGLDAGFMNGAFLYSPVLGRTIPYSTFGVGAAYLSNGYPVFTVTVFDTNDDSKRSVFDKFFDNGVIIYPTVSLPTQFFGMPGHQTLWGAYSTGQYDIIDPASLTLAPAVLARQGLVPPTTSVRGSWWLSYRFDQALWVDPADQTRSWGLFGDIGVGDGKPNPAQFTVAVGLAGTSPIAGRPQDTFGLAYYFLDFSSDFKDVASAVAPVRDERGFEFFYQVGVTPWCHVTADLQVITPALRSAETALVLGLRAKVDF